MLCIKRSGMACCPFHDDNERFTKLYEDTLLREIINEIYVVRHFFPPKISLFCLSFQHRLLLSLGISPKFTISWDFPITFEMARAYQKANGRYLRESQWTDIVMTLSLEIGK